MVVSNKGKKDYLLQLHSASLFNPEEIWDLKSVSPNKPMGFRKCEKEARPKWFLVHSTNIFLSLCEPHIDCTQTSPSIFPISGLNILFPNPLMRIYYIFKSQV
jgi:hypothetical protein